MGLIPLLSKEEGIFILNTILASISVITTIFPFSLAKHECLMLGVRIKETNLTIGFTKILMWLRPPWTLHYDGLLKISGKHAYAHTHTSTQ